ncbi:hypothetical protein [Vreelandella malpeensis]|uniref:Uncharacterized protein n=1 Tax=Vreelandella malpeensis TaxID=1172368 RepID=A0ABS8DUJ8_9GAMM|nr:hypothetical protein [Halomonas malpeensis]MCB8889926.1 hypothetical protein [Halomonas malpeensis]
MKKLKKILWLALLLPSSAFSDHGHDHVSSAEQRLYTEDEVLEFNNISKQLAVLAMKDQLFKCHLQSMFYIRLGDIQDSESISFEDLLSRFEGDEESLNIIREVYSSNLEPFDLASNSYPECANEVVGRMMR